MKRILVLLFCVCYCITVSGQARKFWYDESGNRTSRKTITLSKSATGVSEENSKQNEPITDKIGETSILIFPNPARSLITVEIQGLENNRGDMITLYDQSGRLVLTLTNLTWSNNLDMSALQTGIYFMVIKLKNNTTKWSIIKE
jgi:hypothetical protein